MRCFVAVVPPPVALDHLDDFLEPRRAAADFRWTAPDQVHLTLAFIGDLAERRLDDLVERLERAASRRRTTSTAITGGGAFPHAAGAKVLWAGLDLDEDDAVEVRRMADGARAAANRAGAKVAGQRFRPHLTVARCGRPTEVSSWVKLLDAYRGPEWTIDAFTLVESHLGEGPRGRPRYEVVADFPLG
ncbi:RNA 2',3'-cyclic phosphodiesterase [Nocardioides jishulii]|uniref:RNA 2',3'-cyclic phosphodiesterase n=1 Tax=Nocardioides jishulii TaxID=2575440 RepID=A0A4U2YS10_9ACTN|nr:RNA 2',3'-cyclic phosphodiesterase [Nocardioides jishulii]QCX28894.1 RNA 2',3'-cyclic phosphodiesterase [Nocardioides jishulii]TKI64209.1 RNA 2',3'-cyclic phosphodiesterase [Nocardioides jishulii]